MSSLYSNAGIALEFNGSGDVIGYIDRALHLTWEGTPTSWSYSLTGDTVRDFPVIEFAPELFSAKGGNHLTSPAEDTVALAADISWNDGVSRSATVLIAAENAASRLVIAAIDGDALPTASTDLAAWYAGLTINAPSGPFGTGSTFTTADLGYFTARFGSLYKGTDGDDPLVNGGTGYDYYVPTPGRDRFDGGGSDAQDAIHANRMILTEDPNLNINLSKGFIKWEHGRLFVSNVDDIAGTDYDDILKGNGNENRVTGNGGADIILTFDGADQIFAGDGNDRVWGGDGDDYVRGGDDDDKLRGQEGNDRIAGEGGADAVRGSDGNDVLFGDGEAGETQSDGDDRVLGGKGDDVLYGGGGDDKLEGNSGADTLYGGSGADGLRGNRGTDILDGGEGNDNLYGGEKADTFVFTDTPFMGRDKIKDFEDGIDVLDISDYFWDEATLLANLSVQSTHVRVDFGIHPEGSGMRAVIIENTDLADITAADFIGLIDA